MQSELVAQKNSPEGLVRGIRKWDLVAVAINGIIGADDVLDAQSLPKVNMPNKDGFIPFPRAPK